MNALPLTRPRNFGSEYSENGGVESRKGTALEKIDPHDGLGERSSRADPMVSVICVYNDRELFASILKQSLERQDSCTFEVVTLDNCNSAYRSAPEAFLQAIRRAKGDLLLFVHQDVELYEPNALAQLWSHFKKSQNGIMNSAVGVSGAYLCKDWTGRTGVRVVSSEGFLENGRPPTHGNVGHGVREVQTFDECLFALPRRLLDFSSFQDIPDAPWDLYVALLSYRLRLSGVQNLIVPLAANHVYLAKYSSRPPTGAWRVDAARAIEGQMKSLHRFYRASYAVEKSLARGSRWSGRRAVEPLACPSARFPIPSARTSAYRFLLGASKHTADVFPFASQPLKYIATRRIARQLHDPLCPNAIGILSGVSPVHPS